MEYELRPLSLAEILDAAFRLVRTHWRTLIGLALIMQIPIVLVGAQASWLFDPFATPFDPGAEPSEELILEMVLAGGGLFLAYLLLYPFVAGAVTAAVGNFYLGRRFELGDAIKAGLSSLVRLVLAYIVYSFAIVGIMLVFGIGVAVFGIVFGTADAGAIAVILGVVAILLILGLVLYVGAASSMLAPVVVLESEGIFGSVGRVFGLANTAKWRVVGVILTAGLIVGVPVVGAQSMIGFIPYGGLLVWGLFQAIGFAFTTSVAVVLYFDLRCRAENYDLELLAEQVEAGPGLGEQ